MRKMGVRQRRHKKAGLSVVNVLASIFEIAEIPFSQNHNKQYGMSEFVTMMMFMIRNASTAESAGRHIINYKNIPVGRWFRNMVHGIKEKKAELLCKILLERTIEIAKKCTELKKGRVYVAIDKHLLARYDKGESDQVVGSKRKSGTSKFEAYATIQVVAGKVNAILDCFRFVSGSTNVDFIVGFMGMLAKQGVVPRLLLLDREFYAANIMNALDGLKIQFLMPAVKNDGIKKAILEYHNNTRAAVSQYTIKARGGMSFTFTLIIRKSRKAEKNSKGKRRSTAKEPTIESMYVAFATNLPEQHALREIGLIPKEYKLRWGIETAYRQIEEIRPWTTSKNETYRRILFYTALFMYNMWASERVRSGVDTKEMTLQFLAEVAYMTVLLHAGINSQFPMKTSDPG